MPLDDTNWNYGDDGMPQQSRLTLSGVYKHQAQGPADYCAVGHYNGKEILIAERAVLALNADTFSAGTVLTVQQLQRVGKQADNLNLTAREVLRVIDHINNIASDSRPHPMAAVA